MGDVGRKIHPLHGIDGHSCLSAQRYLQNIHLADKNIRLKIFRLGKLHGYRTRHYLITTLNIYHGDEIGKRRRDNRAFATGIIQFVPSIRQRLLGILKLTLSQGKLLL
ncbi:hypothetical protein ACFLWZ_08705, partial [Chloroflexota bacterium]